MTSQEIAELEAYIAGLPPELRDGADAESYKARLAAMQWRRWFADNCAEWNGVHDVEADLDR